ncbi:MAG TPA: hypothetical protein VG146_00300 [Verrucomicrobiae bacterium]|nr:hypothetical protein [Verrucomicrobiae bacterium]
MLGILGARLFPKATPIERRVKTRAVLLTTLAVLVLIGAVALITAWASGLGSVFHQNSPSSLLGH